MTGDNGALTKVQNSKIVTTEAEVEEQIKLAWNSASINNAFWGYNDEQKKNSFKMELEKLYGEDTVTVKTISTKSYYIKIENLGDFTIDNEKIIKINENINFAEDILTEGDYVYYIGPNNENILCRVLYDKNSEYGTQIITENTIEQVTLGANDITVDQQLAINTNFTLNNVTIDDNFKKSVFSYNNGVKTLNQNALKYNNYDLSYGARCAGSVPNEINSEKMLKSYSVVSTKEDGQEWSFKGEFKSEDNNYKIDVDQMKKIGIIGSNHNYILCSRKERVYSYGFSFGFRTIRYRNNQWEDYYSYFIQDNRGNPYGGDRTEYFRPVFLLYEGCILQNNEKDGKTIETAYVLDSLN